MDELIHIARRMRRIALQSAAGGMAPSILGMFAAAFGFLPPIGGAIAQEIINLAQSSMLFALRYRHACSPTSNLSCFCGFAVCLKRTGESKLGCHTGTPSLRSPRILDLRYCKGGLCSPCAEFRDGDYQLNLTIIWMMRWPMVFVAYPKFELELVRAPLLLKVRFKF